MTAGDSFGRLDDDYLAYTTGRAAEMLGTTQGFLRAIGEARLMTPLRSAGGPEAQHPGDGHPGCMLRRDAMGSSPVPDKAWLLNRRER
ncbi:hypothetical protein [Streptomyces sp. NPDC057287]|uniref:hypothetical protein n=1 Tax=Streptomyces sp. NPDC057287 TaxID=3346086 RepID=UPI003644F72E